MPAARDKKKRKCIAPYFCPRHHPRPSKCERGGERDERRALTLGPCALVILGEVAIVVVLFAGLFERNYERRHVIGLLMLANYSSLKESAWV